MYLNVLLPISFDWCRDIDNARNPVQLTRDRLERAATENQFMNGKIHAIEVRTQPRSRQPLLITLRWLALHHSGWMAINVLLVKSYRSLLDASLAEHFPELAPHLEPANRRIISNGSPGFLQSTSSEDVKPVIKEEYSTSTSFANGIP